VLPPLAIGRMLFLMKFIFIIANNVNVTGFLINHTNGDDSNIMLGFVENCSIINNKCEDNKFGITVSYSSNNTIVNNYCSNNWRGINVAQAYNNTIINNTLLNNEEGIYIEYSDNNMFLDNNITNNSIGLNITLGSDNCQLINTSITNCTNYDVQLNASSHVLALHCSINWSNVNYIDSISDLTVQWYMHVNVTNVSGLPVSGAQIVVENNASQEIFNGLTGAMGWQKWIVCTEYIENITGKTSILTPHNVSVMHPQYEPGYADPEPNMNMTQTVDVILSPDVTAPNPPINFTFSAVGATYLNLSWEASNSPDVEGYNIYINDTGSSAQFLGRVGNQKWDLESKSWIRDLDDGWKIHTDDCREKS